MPPPGPFAAAPRQAASRRSSLAPGASADLALLNLASSASADLRYRRAESLLPCGCAPSGGRDPGGRIRALGGRRAGAAPSQETRACRLLPATQLHTRHTLTSPPTSPPALPHPPAPARSLTQDELHELLGRLGAPAPKSDGGRHEGGTGGVAIGGGVVVTEGGAGGTGSAGAGGEARAEDLRASG